MPALWVLAVVALLLVLILSIRLRVVFTAKDDNLTLEVRAAFFRYRVLPPPEEKPSRKKKKPAPEKPKEPAPTRTVTETVQRLLALLDRFWEPVTGVLRNIRGEIRVDPLTVHVTYGGRDEPADAAILCGDTLAAVWAVMPVLETLCRIPGPRITVDTDFDAPNNVRLDAQIGLTLRVWALLVSLRPLLVLLRKQTPKQQ